MSNSQRPPAAGLVRQNRRNKKSIITRIVTFLFFLTSLIFNFLLSNKHLNQYLRVDDNNNQVVQQQSNQVVRLHDEEEASLIAIADGKKRTFPSWAVVTQCSLYHTDCPNHLDFQDYPFPLPPEESQLQQEDDKRTGATDEWIEEFIKEFQQKSNTSDTHLIGYEFPSKVDDAKRQECIISSQTLSVEAW